MDEKDLPVWIDDRLDDVTDEEGMDLLRRNEFLRNIHVLARDTDRMAAEDFPDGNPTLQFSGLVEYKGRMLEVVYDAASDTYAGYMGYVKAGVAHPKMVRVEAMIRREAPDDSGDFDLIFEDPLEQIKGAPVPLVMHVKTRLLSELKMGQAGRITKPAEQTTLAANFPGPGGELDLRMHETAAMQRSQNLKPPYRVGVLNVASFEGTKPAEESHE